MRATEKYAQLVARGCMCGSDRPQDCPIHKAGDNRGIRAYFEAGMPQGFPTAASCAICGSEGLMYPNVEIDDPNGAGEYKPTLVCPSCSTQRAERALVAECSRYALNDRRVFA